VAGNGVHVNYQAETRWELACRMGVQLFYNYFRTQKRGNVEITIYDVGWLPVDTNNLTVMFTVMNRESDLCWTYGKLILVR
jgi:hypothetical protein